MTTERSAKGWTPEEEAQIASIMETRKLNRMGAIQYMKRQAAKAKPIQQPDELNAKLAELGDNAPHVAARPALELGSHPVTVVPVKAKAPKAIKGPNVRTPKAKATKSDIERYDKELVIRLWERDKLRPMEIAAAADKYAGLRCSGRNISPVYVSRVLFGSKNSGGVNAEQAKRRKLDDERRDAGQKARAGARKKESK